MKGLGDLCHEVFDCAAFCALGKSWSELLGNPWEMRAAARSAIGSDVTVSSACECELGACQRGGGEAMNKSRAVCSVGSWASLTWGSF